MKYLIIFLIIFINFICSIVSSQNTSQIVHYMYELDDRIVKMKEDTLSIIKPFILVGEIIDPLAFTRIQDSSFNAIITSNNYLENKGVEEHLRMNCYSEYYIFFRKYRLQHQLIEISNNDLMVINEELNYIEKNNFNSKNDSVKVSKRILDILNKYPGNMFLLTDIKEYYEGKNDVKSNNKGDNFWQIIKVIIIDKRSNKIIYNNYQTYKDRRTIATNANSLVIKKVLNKFRKNLRMPDKCQYQRPYNCRVFDGKYYENDRNRTLPIHISPPIHIH